QPGRLAGRHDLPFDGPGQQVVLRLHGDRAGRQATRLRQVDVLLDLPGGEVGQPDVVDLACPHRVVQEAQRLLHPGQRVPAVQLVQVDGVDLQTPQRAVEGPGQVLPGQAEAVRAR